MKKCSYPVMALILALPVMFRGLFFELDFSIYAAIVLFVLAIMALLCKNIKFCAITDTSLAVLTALYGLSCLFAVNKGLALTEFLKYITLFAIYLAVKATAKENSGKTTVMFSVVLAAGVSAVISLFTAAGVLNYAGAYSTSEIEKWLNGTVQYHNAFGALMVCALFVSCALNKNNSKTVKAVNGVLAYFISFGMIMSYSRGAWVTAPVAFIVYMIFADKETRLSFFEIAATSVLATVAVLSKFTQFVELGNAASAVLWLLAGFVIYAALYAVISVIFKFFQNMKYFNITAVVMVSVVVVLAVGIVLVPQAFSAVLPSQLVERLSGISFGAETVKERFVFYKDALDIAKRSLIFGSGGGAWQDLYGMSQSYYYSSSQAHSYIMQVLVETGVLGLLTWLVTVIIFYVMAVKLLVKKSADRKILAGTVSAVTVLIAHSIIDFDLSISAISIILWALLAVVFAYDNKSYSINKHIGTTACVVFAIIFILNTAALDAYQKGGQYLANNQQKLAYERFEKSSALRPFDSTALSYKAMSLSYDIKDQSEREKIVSDMDKAEKLAPNSIITNQNAMTVYSNLGAYDVAMDYARKLVTLQPMNIDNYYSYLLSGYQVVSFYYRGENAPLAKKISDEVLTIKDFVEDLNSKRLEKIEFTDEMKEMLMYFQVVSYNVK